jgi:hypothetical protein
VPLAHSSKRRMINLMVITSAADRDMTDIELERIGLTS